MEQVAARYAAGKVEEQDIKRRAVEAAIWGIPIVSLDAMRRAFTQDAGAGEGDIAVWSQPPGDAFPLANPDAATQFGFSSFSTRHGPVVLEVPASRGARLAGAIADAWQWELTDVGSEGEDRGLGARYLVLPPGFNGTIPAGYIPVRSSTYNVYTLVRALPFWPDAPHIAAAVDLVRRIRIYPLALAANPPQQRHIDRGSQALSTRLPSDAAFFESLARMVDEEPVRDIVAIGHLKALGIRTGQSFRPDRLTRELLSKAASEAHTAFMRTAMKGHPWWSERQFNLSITAGPRTGFSYLTGDRLETYERAILFFIGRTVPAKPDATTSFTGAFCTPASDARFEEASTRFLGARRFWAAAIHGSDNAWFIRDSAPVSADRKVTFIRFYQPQR